MMDIVMLVAGAGIGAMLRDLFVLYRGGENKTRQQLESKTPYDYALTNAINERDRLQDELRTIQISRRVEKQVENYRNAIEEILAEDGGEATECAYEHNIGMPIRDNGDGTFSPIAWDNRISSGEMVDNISKAYTKVFGTNVREDVSKGERMTEDDVERASYWRLANLAEERRQVTVHWKSPAGEFGEHFEHKHTGQLNGYSRTQDGLEHITVGNVCIDGDKVECITKGRDINGETLYRKGNR